MRRASVGSRSLRRSPPRSPSRSLVAPTRVAAQSSDTDAATQELAERYAPIVMLKDQEQECDTYGEPFAPMSVDAVARQRADRVTSGRQWRSVDDACSGRERLVRTGRRLLPRLPRRCVAARLPLRARLPSLRRALSADRVRARRATARPSRPDRRPVLALLVLQRLEQQARGRLGVRAGSASRLIGRGGPHRRADRRRIRPAHRR